jgi:hypothetical protein
MRRTWTLCMRFGMNFSWKFMSLRNHFRWGTAEEMGTRQSCSFLTCSKLSAFQNMIWEWMFWETRFPKRALRTTNFPTLWKSFRFYST